MRIGVVFPQTEIGNDPQGIRDFAVAAEDLGYTHLIAYDHVLGANPASRPGWSGAYSYKNPFHEPLILFGYLAAVTRRIEFMSGVLILAQRQTALVAKQCAAVDVLSKGRLRLGIGIGWNAVEFEALGENFHTRGARYEEQIQVLRELWTKELVTFKGKWHTITDAGINPLPVQRPIPLWLGGRVEKAIRRAARVGDGWFAVSRAGDDRAALVKLFHDEVKAAGRDPKAVGVEVSVRLRDTKVDQLPKVVEQWAAQGGTHISVQTMDAGFKTPKEHIEAITRARKALGAIK